MELCELFLIGIIFSLGIVVIVTDFQIGVIRNKVLLAATSAGLIVNLIYIILTV